MYGGSSKHGRLGGGGGAPASKLSRSSFPPPQRSSAPGPTSAAPAVDEKFSLVGGSNLAFGMIIKLTPDLVEEIRRVEAKGGTPRIKFDSHSNSPDGNNVIDVGGKEFRFTWSKDGDLCDIYEERQTGEDGNGLLVESGCAWRKVSVQRVLDESTSRNVKRRTEEAKPMHKSRKTIVLELNTSTKNQLAQYDTSANNSWKNFKHKKDPPYKKQKVEPPPAPPKSAYKSGVSSATTAKGRPSSSPLPSTPEKSASPFGMLNLSKTHASAHETISSKAIIKEKSTPSLDRDTSIRTSAGTETTGKGSGTAKPTNLQSLLITLLMENPKGMNVKALEKGVGVSFPNSAKKIEPILKKIANCQASGKYFLKPGVELESIKKPLIEPGNSPEENICWTPAADDICDQRPVEVLESNEKVSPNEMEEHGEKELNATVGEELQAYPKVDNQQQSPDLFGEKRASDNIEARVASSSSSGSGSDSDSDSDSDSSDSGSDSGSPSKKSRSKSKSPVRGGSGSSSDSDSDVSSKSKEVSDEDVNIMSDDDNEPKLQIQASGAGFPIPLCTLDGKLAQSENDDKQDDESNAIDIETVEQDAELAVVSSSLLSKEHVMETTSSPPELIGHHDRQNLVESLCGKTTDKDDFKYEQPDNSMRASKGNLKRGLVKHSDEKSERRKRSKQDNSLQPPASLGKGAHYSKQDNLSPDRLIEDSYKGPESQMFNEADRDGNTDSLFGSQKGYTQAASGRYSSESKYSSRMSYDHSAQDKAPDQVEKPDGYPQSLGLDGQNYENSSHTHEGFPVRKDNVHSSSQKNGYANEKKASRNSKEGGAQGKQSVLLGSHYLKHGDVAGNMKEGRQVSSVPFSSLPRENKNGADRSPCLNGRAPKLQREISELELGELREAVAEEIPVKKQFEKKGSFKQSETKPGSRDNWFPDISRAKSAGQTSSELGKSSSQDLNLKYPSTLEGLVKKRNYEDSIEDLTTGSQPKALQSQSQHLSRVDHSDVRRPFSRSADNGSKKKAPLSVSQHHDSKRGSLANTNKQSKRPASSMIMEQTDVPKDPLLAEGTDSDRKRRDSSSDENSCSYTKYEKDEPELKGPIKDFSQYKEFVQEYRDKYESYCSLNKILENYRNKFMNLGKDLELATKGTERYFDILDELKESYRQCGARHKRIKKIFMVLHDELKHLKQRIKDFALLYTKE